MKFAYEKMAKICWLPTFYKVSVLFTKGLLFFSEHEIPSLPENEEMYDSNSTLQERMLNDKTPDKQNRRSTSQVSKYIMLKGFVCG